MAARRPPGVVRDAYPNLLGSVRLQVAAPGRVLQGHDQAMQRLQGRVVRQAQHGGHALGHEVHVVLVTVATRLFLHRAIVALAAVLAHSQRCRAGLFVVPRVWRSAWRGPVVRVLVVARPFLHTGGEAHVRARARTHLGQGLEGLKGVFVVALVPLLNVHGPAEALFLVGHFLDRWRSAATGLGVQGGMRVEDGTLVGTSARVGTRTRSRARRGTCAGEAIGRPALLELERKHLGHAGVGVHGKPSHGIMCLRPGVDGILVSHLLTRRLGAVHGGLCAAFLDMASHEGPPGAVSRRTFSRSNLPRMYAFADTGLAPGLVKETLKSLSFLMRTVLGPDVSKSSAKILSLIQGVARATVSVRHHGAPVAS